MLTNALHARTGGDLGAASLPRHLRRRATSHNPYRGSTKRRPNAKRRRALIDAAGLAPYAGLAVEAQRWPDAPHHPAFPSFRITPEATFRQVTEWRFARDEPLD